VILTLALIGLEDHWFSPGLKNAGIKPIPDVPGIKLYCIARTPGSSNSNYANNYMGSALPLARRRLVTMGTLGRRLTQRRLSRRPMSGGIIIDKSASSTAAAAASAAAPSRVMSAPVTGGQRTSCNG